MSKETDETEQDYLMCTSCEKIDETVHERCCVYQSDINNNHEAWETVCDDCEYEHAMDI